MEDWAFDFEWLKVRHQVKDVMQQQNLPTLQIMLFLIGIQELGIWKEEFTKEEKQDLMHIGVCAILADEGYYKFEGRDEQGWPHFIEIKSIEKQSVEEQERFLKMAVIQYFNKREQNASQFKTTDDLVQPGD